MSRIRLHSPGSCYILINDSLPGLVKIGASTDEPYVRAKQLSASTSAPTPFHVAYHRAVDDVNDIESRMHEALDQYRVNEGREFFSCSLYRAITVLDLMVGGNVREQDPPTPMSELFASFPDDNSPRSLTPEESARCRALERSLR